MKKSFPPELIELFESQFEREFPWPVDGPGSSEAYWSFRVAEGIGILKCTLRDGLDVEDFEWELFPKSR